MCGITGFIDPNARIPDVRAPIERMTDSMVLRGPDDRGVLVDPSAGLALGHRRLSVIDPTACGRQPMKSASGRLQLVFNGRGPEEIQLALDLQHGMGRCGRWRSLECAAGGRSGP